MEKKQFQPKSHLPENKEYRDKYLDRLPNSLFQKNRAKFIQKFKQSENGSKAKQVALLKGNDDVPMYHADVDYFTFQESNFYYLFGVQETGCYGLIDFDKETGVLFVPNHPKLLEIWMTVLRKEEFEKKYEMEVHLVEELKDYLQKEQPSEVHLIGGINPDSGLSPALPSDELLGGLRVNKEAIFDMLGDCRVVKSDEEIEVMRWASKISCEAHIQTMQAATTGMRESNIGDIFTHYGRMHYYTDLIAPYQPINCCGESTSTLHYIDRNKWLQDGQTILIDQAHNVHHYCSDITTCWPVNGKFTQKQKDIYDIVLKANRAVMSQLKPGVSWLEMHLLAERVILEGLVALGLLRGDVQEMLEGRLGFVFQPHGLGHLLGIDVHDAGGYTKSTPQRVLKPGLKNLRTARVMEKGITITVEPGIYFRDFLLEEKDLNKVLAPLTIISDHQRFLNIDKIKEYQKEISGVRIEDVVLITENGCENLSADVPRTTEEIEKCMRGEPYK